MFYFDICTGTSFIAHIPVDPSCLDELRLFIYSHRQNLFRFTIYIARYFSCSLAHRDVATSCTQCKALKMLDGDPTVELAAAFSK